MKVLIIEDDPATVETISLSFQVGWPEAKVISTKLGEEGIGLVEQETPDLVILDLGLPDIDGFEVLKGIRLFSNVPVIILTVRGEEADVVKGLEWEADEYIVKPFRQLELLARVRSIIRKQHYIKGELYLNCGPFQFDISRRKLKHGKKVVNLTSTESLILYHLVINSGRAVTLSSLAQEVWGDDYTGAAEAIRVYIRHLREKIEPNPDKPQLIVTKPGVGYTFVKSG